MPADLPLMLLGWHWLAGSSKGSPITDFFLTDSNLFCIMVIRKRGFTFGLFGLGLKHQERTVYSHLSFSFLPDLGSVVRGGGISSVYPF